MIPSEVSGIYNFTADYSPSFPANFGIIQNNIPGGLPVFQFSRFLSNLPNYQQQDFTPQASCVSNNSSTSDEAEDHQLSIIDERRQRRMISNRESARRSRMRKQRHLDELWSQVAHLRTEKNSLVDKLNELSDCHDRVVQENARLKMEASDLRQMLADLQLDSTYNALKELEEISCSTTADHLSAESSNQSSTATTSANMLL